MTSTSGISELKKLTSELHLADELDRVQPMENVSIAIPVLEGSATVTALRRVQGHSVIAEYFAERGTRLKRQVRTETWYLIVVSGAMQLQQEGGSPQQFERRGTPCMIVSGTEYTLFFPADTWMVLVAIPDASEFIALRTDVPEAARG